MFRQKSVISNGFLLYSQLFLEESFDFLKITQGIGKKNSTLRRQEPQLAYKKSPIKSLRYILL